MKLTIHLILYEFRIRFLWMFFCFIITLITSYIYSQEFIYLLSKPLLYLIINNHEYFICTHITEAFSAYIFISFFCTLCFCVPYFYYQFWCFFIPSCYKSQRSFYNHITFLSTLCFLCIFYLTYIYLIPNLWYFFYNFNQASELSFQLQPKIFDYLLFVVHFLTISIMISQIPIFMICLIQARIVNLSFLIQSRRIFLFLSMLIAALLSPPEIWCQFVTFVFLFGMIELAIFYIFLMLRAL